MHSEVSQKRHLNTMAGRGALQCGERQQRHPRNQDPQEALGGEYAATRLE